MALTVFPDVTSACWGGNSSVQISHWILPANSSVSSVSLWPPLAFGTSADCWNSVLWNPRTSIRKGEAHKLKPTSSNLPPSCLVPGLAYALPLSSAFVGVCWRNRFRQNQTIRRIRHSDKSDNLQIRQSEESDHQTTCKSDNQTNQAICKSVS